MNCKVKMPILLLLSFVWLTSVSAKNLKIEEISASLEAIQIGAFKEEKNILQAKRHFFDYDIFVENGDKVNRVYIVNIKKDNFNGTLAEIKKSIPSAFSASGKIRKLLKNYPPTVSFTRKIKAKKNAYHDSPFLNSETILKTRKKFF